MHPRSDDIARAGDRSEATESLVVVVAAAPEQKAQPEGELGALTYWGKATAHAARKEYDLAIEEYNKAIKLNPLKPELRAERKQALLQAIKNPSNKFFQLVAQADRIDSAGMFVDIQDEKISERDQNNLFNKIDELQDQELKLNLLSQALARNTFLGKLFHKRVEDKEPNVTYGVLKKIAKELEKHLAKLSEKMKAILREDKDLANQLIQAGCNALSDVLFAGAEVYYERGLKAGAGGRAVEEFTRAIQLRPAEGKYYAARAQSVTHGKYDSLSVLNDYITAAKLDPTYDNLFQVGRYVYFYFKDKTSDGLRSFIDAQIFIRLNNFQLDKYHKKYWQDLVYQAIGWKAYQSQDFFKLLLFSNNWPLDEGELHDRMQEKNVYDWIGLHTSGVLKQNLLFLAVLKETYLGKMFRTLGADAIWLAAIATLEKELGSGCVYLNLHTKFAMTESHELFELLKRCGPDQYKNLYKIYLGVCFELGDWHYRRGGKDNFSLAASLFKKILELQPDNIEAHIHLANTYSRQRYVVKAVNLYFRVISLSSSPEMAVRQQCHIVITKALANPSRALLQSLTMHFLGAFPDLQVQPDDVSKLFHIINQLRNRGLKQKILCQALIKQTFYGRFFASIQKEIEEALLAEISDGQILLTGLTKELFLQDLSLKERFPVLYEKIKNPSAIVHDEKQNQAIDEKSYTADDYVRRGISQLDLGKQALALEDFKKAAVKGSSEAYYLLGSLDEKDALSNYNKAIQLAPNDVALRNARKFHLVRKLDLPSAENLKVLLDVDGNIFDDISNEIIDTHGVLKGIEWLKDFKLKREILEKASTVGTFFYNLFANHRIEIEALLKETEVVVVVANNNKVVESKKNVDHRARGLTYTKEKQYDLAVKEYKEAKRLNPADEKANALCKDALLAAMQHPLDAFLEIVANPDNVNMFADIERAINEDIKEALFKKIKSLPDPVKKQHLLCQILARDTFLGKIFYKDVSFISEAPDVTRGILNQVAQELEQCVTQLPDDSIKKALQKDKIFNEQIIKAGLPKLAEALCPLPDAKSYAARARKLGNYGRRSAEVIPDLSRAIALDSKNWELLAERGSAYFKSRRLREALADYSAVVKHQRQFDALYNYASICAELDNPIDAIRYYNAAISEYPHDSKRHTEVFKKRNQLLRQFIAEPTIDFVTLLFLSASWSWKSGAVPVSRLLNIIETTMSRDKILGINLYFQMLCETTFLGKIQGAKLDEIYSRIANTLDGMLYSSRANAEFLSEETKKAIRESILLSDFLKKHPVSNCLLSVVQQVRGKVPDMKKETLLRTFRDSPSKEFLTSWLHPDNWKRFDEVAHEAIDKDRLLEYIVGIEDQTLRLAIFSQALSKPHSFYGRLFSTQHPLYSDRRDVLPALFSFYVAEVMSSDPDKFLQQSESVALSQDAKANEFYVTHPKVFILICEHYLEKGDHQKAILFSTCGMKLLNSSPLHPNERRFRAAQLYDCRAQAYYAAEQYSVAISDYENTSYLEDDRHIRDCYYKLKNFHKAFGKLVVKGRDSFYLTHQREALLKEIKDPSLEFFQYLADSMDVIDIIDNDVNAKFKEALFEKIKNVSDPALKQRILCQALLKDTFLGRIFYKNLGMLDRSTGLIIGKILYELEQCFTKLSEEVKNRLRADPELMARFKKSPLEFPKLNDELAPHADSKLYFDNGKKLEAAKKYQAALLYFDRAIACQKEAPREYYLSRASAYRALTNPEVVAKKIERAQQYVQAKNFIEAIRCMNDAVILAKMLSPDVMSNAKHEFRSTLHDTFDWDPQKFLHLFLLPANWNMEAFYELQAFANRDEIFCLICQQQDHKLKQNLLGQILSSETFFGKMFNDKSYLSRAIEVLNAELEGNISEISPETLSVLLRVDIDRFSQYKNIAKVLASINVAHGLEAKGEAAVAFFSTALKLDSSAAHVYYERGMARAETRQYDFAILDLSYAKLKSTNQDLKGQCDSQILPMLSELKQPAQMQKLFNTLKQHSDKGLKRGIFYLALLPGERLNIVFSLHQKEIAELFMQEWLTSLNDNDFVRDAQAVIDNPVFKTLLEDRRYFAAKTKFESLRVPLTVAGVCNALGVSPAVPPATVVVPQPLAASPQIVKHDAPPAAAQSLSLVR